MKIQARDVAADQVVVIDGRKWLVGRAEKALTYVDNDSRILLTLERAHETRAVVFQEHDMVEIHLPVDFAKIRAEDIRPGMTIEVDGIRWDVVSAMSHSLTTLTVRKPGAKTPAVVVLWNDLLLDVVA